MKTIIIIVLFLIFLFVAAWLVVEIGKRNVLRSRRSFEEYYKHIKFCVEYSPVTESTYKTIRDMFAEVKDYPDKNIEKLQVLEQNFYLKFRTIKNDNNNEF